MRTLVGLFRVGARLRAWRTLLVAMMLTAAIVSSGCVHTPPPVMPWQREHLAKRALRFDTDPVEMRFRQHLWGSREGSDLGFGQPGGGCGCN